MATKILTRRVAISKTYAQMVVILAVSSFLVIFCLVASSTLISQNSYQARVISAMNKSKKQLQQNLQVFNQLAASYNKFNSSNTNIIGGPSSGSGQNSGLNSQIILDALPPAYDFPALTSSLQNILSSYNISSISGTDDELSQQGNNTSPNPQPVSMPFSFTINNASYQSVSQLFTTLQNSIRPIQVDSLDLSGVSSSLTLTVSAHTYYQPAKTVSISQEVIK